MASEIQVIQESLNVKENNLNNKRLSRLQGVILKILTAVYPGGYSKRALSQLVARGYGKGSVISSDDMLKKQLDDATQRVQDDSNMLLGIEKLRSAHKKLVAIPLGHARDGYLAPKFSVSYSRSIRNLLEQGLIGCNYRGILFATEKGCELAASKKVKVDARFWDAFQAFLRGSCHSHQ